MKKKKENKSDLTYRSNLFIDSKRSFVDKNFEIKDTYFFVSRRVSKLKMGFHIIFCFKKKNQKANIDR
jgi:hypothetical protein